MIARPADRVSRKSFGLPIPAAQFERELQDLIDAVPGAIYRFQMSPDGAAEFTFISRGVESLIGLPRELVELNFAAFRQRVHPEDEERVAGTILRAIQTRSAWTCEFRVVVPHAGIRWLRGHATPEMPSHDGTLFWNGILTDVTREKQIERELVRIRNEWRTTVDAVGAMIILEDGTGRVVRCNQAVCDVLGLAFRQILGRNLNQLFFGEDSQEPHRAFRSRRSVIRFSGNLRWYEIASDPLEHSRDTSGWVHVLTDVTEHRLAEEKAQRFTAAITQAAEAVLTLSPSGRIEYVNPAFSRETGYSPDEALGRNVRELRLGPDDRRTRLEIRRALAAGRGWQGRYTTRWHDGPPRHEEVSISPVRDDTGEVCNYVIVGRDVTEREHLEAVASAVNMMDHVGFVFSAIRHELGNPVNSIKTALSVLRQQLDQYPRAAIADYLDRTLSEIGRVEYLLKAFKTFNMFEHPRIEPVGMNRFLGDFLQLLGEDFGQRGIAIELRADAGLGDGMFDPRALHQALLNLVTNAADAVAGCPDPRVLLCARRRGRWIQLRVEDNGKGMDEAQLGKLFRPFFTTKPSGNGLGLAIVKKLVTKMGGSVEVESEQGQGTAFTLSLLTASSDAA